MDHAGTQVVVETDPLRPRQTKAALTITRKMTVGICVGRSAANAQNATGTTDGVRTFQVAVTSTPGTTTANNILAKGDASQTLNVGGIR